MAYFEVIPQNVGVSVNIIVSEKVVCILNPWYNLAAFRLYHHPFILHLANFQE